MNQNTLYTNVELMCATLLLTTLPRPKTEPEEIAFGMTVSDFLMCDGPGRLQARMAAIAVVNSTIPNPLKVEAVTLSQELSDQLSDKIKSMGGKTFQMPKPRN